MCCYDNVRSKPDFKLIRLIVVRSWTVWDWEKYRVSVFSRKFLCTKVLLEAFKLSHKIRIRPNLVGRQCEERGSKFQFGPIVEVLIDEHTAALGTLTRYAFSKIESSGDNLDSMVRDVIDGTAA